jgi:hypothetical protein
MRVLLDECLPRRFADESPRPWIVIVEPDGDVNLLVVVTVYEVSE